MYLQLEVFDNRNMFRGNAGISINWTQKTWQVLEDKSSVWNRLCNSKNGKFEYRSNDVIWLWDQLRNPVIFWTPPKHGTDYSRSAGEARIYDPKDSALKEGRIKWKIDMTKKLGAAVAAMANNSALSPLRVKLLQRLREVLPCSYGDKNYNLIAPGLTKQGGGYTTCGSLPGFVTSFLGAGDPHKPEWKTYMQRRSLNGTNAVRIKGLQYDSWVWGGEGKRPKPGDVYALLNNGKTDRKLEGISHVGVIMDSSGDVWKTADMGQGDGWSGKMDVIRPYKSASDELFGETIQGGGYRTLAGWVDIDKYFSK